MKSFSWFKNTKQELRHQQNRSLNQHERHFIPGVSLAYKPAMEHLIKFTIDPSSM